MTIFGRQFRPAGWSVLLTTFGVIVFIMLGSWQLQRAEYKRGIMDLYQQRLSEPYRRLPVGGVVDTGQQYLKVQLEGAFDLSRQLLVDNRLYQGRAGYHVLTPFLEKGSGNIVLVNRGWVSMGGTRDVLPELLPPRVGSSVRGIVRFPDTGGFQLGEVALGEQWPQVIPFVDMNALRVQLSGKVLPVVLWMAPEEPGHYVRDWRPVWADPEKSRAYAVQWFSFAAISLLLFFVLNVRKSDE